MTLSETNKPLRLSEAIRLGSTLGPQAFNTIQEGDASCAMGAAFKAVGAAGYSLPGEWKPVLHRLYTCPERGEEYCLAGTGWMTIVHLNDNHRWSRERIADWVELQEADLDLAAAIPRADDYERKMPLEPHEQLR